ncbi:hypothetical protein SNEBB_007053 [Seison nebaliae]|nr:hypothetical protein SNEBB_007053 [Seison nebaliae]
MKTSTASKSQVITPIDEKIVEHSVISNSSHSPKCPKSNSIDRISSQKDVASPVASTTTSAINVTPSAQFQLSGRLIDLFMREICNETNENAQFRLAVLLYVYCLKRLCLNTRSDQHRIFLQDVWSRFFGLISQNEQNRISLDRRHAYIILAIFELAKSRALDEFRSNFSIVVYKFVWSPKSIASKAQLIALVSSGLNDIEPLIQIFQEKEIIRTDWDEEKLLLNVNLLKEFAFRAPSLFVKQIREFSLLLPHIFTNSYANKNWEVIADLINIVLRVMIERKEETSSVSNIYESILRVFLSPTDVSVRGKLFLLNALLRTCNADFEKKRANITGIFSTRYQYIYNPNTNEPSRLMDMFVTDQYGINLLKAIDRFQWYDDNGNFILWKTIVHEIFKSSKSLIYPHIVQPVEKEAREYIKSSSMISPLDLHRHMYVPSIIVECADVADYLRSNSNVIQPFLKNVVMETRCYDHVLLKVLPRWTAFVPTSDNIAILPHILRYLRRCLNRAADFPSKSFILLSTAFLVLAFYSSKQSILHRHIPIDLDSAASKKRKKLNELRINMMTIPEYTELLRDIKTIILQFFHERSNNDEKQRQQMRPNVFACLTMLCSIPDDHLSESFLNELLERLFDYKLSQDMVSWMMELSREKPTMAGIVGKRLYSRVFDILNRPLASKDFHNVHQPSSEERFQIFYALRIISTYQWQETSKDAFTNMICHYWIWYPDKTIRMEAINTLFFLLDSLIELNASGLNPYPSINNNSNNSDFLLKKNRSSFNNVSSLQQQQQQQHHHYHHHHHHNQQQQQQHQTSSQKSNETNFIDRLNISSSSTSHGANLNYSSSNLLKTIGDDYSSVIHNPIIFRAVSIIINSLLNLGLADREEIIRLHVYRRFHSRRMYNIYLAQPENLRILFFSLNDTSLAVQCPVVSIIGSLSSITPSFVVPKLRKYLIQLLSELRYGTLDDDNSFNSSKLLSILISSAPRLTRPFIEPMMQGLLKHIKDQPYDQAVINGLDAIGALAQISDKEMIKYFDDLQRQLMPIILQPTDICKRTKALVVFGHMIRSTGKVIEPYLQFSSLMTTLLSTLSLETCNDIEFRGEVVRLLGILGALDSYRHYESIGAIESTSEISTMAKSFPANSQEAASEMKLRNHERKTDMEILVSMGTGEVTDEYYAAIVIATLVKPLQLPQEMSQTSLLQQTLSAITFLFTEIKEEELREKYFNKIMPPFLDLLRSSNEDDFLFEQLKDWFRIMQKHIECYINEIVVVILQKWDAGDRISHTQVAYFVEIIEAIAKALGPEFKQHLPVLLPKMLNVLQDARNENNIEIVLRSISHYVYAFDDSLNIIVVQLIRLFRNSNFTPKTRRTALQTLRVFIQNLDLHDYASQIVHSIRHVFMILPSSEFNEIDATDILQLPLSHPYDDYPTSSNVSTTTNNKINKNTENNTSDENLANQLASIVGVSTNKRPTFSHHSNSNEKKINSKTLINISGIGNSTTATSKTKKTTENNYGFLSRLNPSTDNSETSDKSGSSSTTGTTSTTSGSNSSKNKRRTLSKYGRSRSENSETVDRRREIEMMADVLFECILTFVERMGTAFLPFDRLINHVIEMKAPNQYSRYVEAITQVEKDNFYDANYSFRAIQVYNVAVFNRTVDLANSSYEKSSPQMKSNTKRSSNHSLASSQHQQQQPQLLCNMQMLPIDRSLDNSSDDLESLNYGHTKGEVITSTTQFVNLLTDLDLLLKYSEDNTNREKLISAFQNIVYDILELSSINILRICSTVVMSSYQIAKDLFNSAFLSMWLELTESNRWKISRKLEALCERATSPEMIQIVLSLAEFLEHYDMYQKRRSNTPIRKNRPPNDLYNDQSKVKSTQHNQVTLASAASSLKRQDQQLYDTTNNKNNNNNNNNNVASGKIRNQNQLFLPNIDKKFDLENDHLNYYQYSNDDTHKNDNNITNNNHNTPQPSNVVNVSPNTSGRNGLHHQMNLPQLVNSKRPSTIMKRTGSSVEIKKYDKEKMYSSIGIDICVLVTCAMNSQSFAKALYYQEKLYKEQPDNRKHRQNLISINNYLGQPEAARGVVANVERDGNFEGRLLEKLHQWDSALTVYRNALELQRNTNANDFQNKLDLQHGHMRCLEALGMWTMLNRACKDLFKTNEKNEDRLNTHRMAAIANWGMQKWSSMYEHTKELRLSKKYRYDFCLFRASHSIHIEEYDEAQNYITLARRYLEPELASLANESYSRSYGSMVRAQELAELEEVIHYKLVPEKRQTIEEMWQKRLRSCQQDVETWKRLLRIHSLVIENKKEDAMWLEYMDLCRKCDQLEIAKCVLAELLVCGEKVNVSKLDDVHFLHEDAATDNTSQTVRFAHFSYVWDKKFKDKQFGELLTVYKKMNLYAESFVQLLGQYGEDQQLTPVNESSFPSSNTVELVRSMSVNDETNMEGNLTEAKHLTNLIFDATAILTDSNNVSTNESLSSTAIGVTHEFIPSVYHQNGEGRETGGSLQNGQYHQREMSYDDARRLCAKFHIQLGQWSEILVTDTREPPVEREVIIGYYRNAKELDPNNYDAWQQWAQSNYFKIESMQNDKESDSEEIVQYATNAFDGFARAIHLGSHGTLVNTLRILKLIFDNSKSEKMIRYAMGENGLPAINVRIWLQVIPQLIARIDSKEPIVMYLLKKICESHSQTLIFPLHAALRSSQSARKETAEIIIRQIAEKNQKLVDEATMMAEELIRVAVLWQEMWFERLEEASRLYFVDLQVEAMLDLLEPLHIMINNNEANRTAKENAFYQAFGGELNSAWACCTEFRSTGNVSKIVLAWNIYYRVFQKIRRQIYQMNQLELQYVSPRLLRCRRMQLCIPGSYEPNAPMIRIESVHSVLTIISSKQHPRKIAFRGSNGKDFNFLLKGHEDLKQDERAMQLFSLVNNLLINEPDMCRRNLTIQRYSVIPLSSTGGLLGWVPHCDTLHSLIKSYREMKNIQLDQEVNVMTNVCASHQTLPITARVEVFRHALRETTGDDLANIQWLKSTHSEIWFERRTNYIRSVAVMSMVGYILGLGDRHPSNIMLDRMSGKIVHIDFGDCFEVAMNREKFPERVPFRLTRMMIKAMEATGIEGNFRVTCEMMMDLIRKNKDSLMVILEAFVHDPLVNWKLTRVDVANVMAMPIERRKHFQSIFRRQCNRMHKEMVEIHRKIVDYSIITEVDGVIDSTANCIIGANDEKPVDRPLAIQRIFDKLYGRDCYQPMIVEAFDRLKKSSEHINALKRELEKYESCLCRKERTIIQEEIRREYLKTDKRVPWIYDLEVKKQVAELISYATSNENLCLSYIGWCPLW